MRQAFFLVNQDILTKSKTGQREGQKVERRAPFRVAQPARQLSLPSPDPRNLNCNFFPSVSVSPGLRLAGAALRAVERAGGLPRGCGWRCRLKPRAGEWKQRSEMDVSLCPAKCSFWRIFLLGSVWLDYVGSVLACPANCVCSKTEINCRRPDDGNLFPLLEGQDSGNSNGNASINITDISRNITSIHIENWRSLHTLNAVDMELYTGLQNLTIRNSGLRSIQPRAFAKNPHLRYINLSSNRLTTLSWQLFQTLSLRELRLEQNFFNCSCDIRWMQLWQEQGDAKLNNQNLYCINADGSQLPLFRMNISQCDLPEISVSHVNLTVREGDNAVITCNGSGSPLPDVDWIVTGLQSINTHQTNLNWTNV
ncbi:hypothetical protein H8959_003915, partial [Pygathrix nigripes]